MSKLLAAWPFLAYLAWTVWLLITDAIGDRQRARMAAQEVRQALGASRCSVQTGPQEQRERVCIVIHSGMPE